MAKQAAVPRLTALQHGANQLDARLADIDGRLAAATISKRQVDEVEATLRRGLAKLAEQAWEDQKAILAGLAQRVDLAAGAPLSITLGVPLDRVRTDVRDWCVI